MAMAMAKADADMMARLGYTKSMQEQLAAIKGFALSDGPVGRGTKRDFVGHRPRGTARLLVKMFKNTEDASNDYFFETVSCLGNFECVGFNSFSLGAQAGYDEYSVAFRDVKYDPIYARLAEHIEAVPPLKPVDEETHEKTEQVNEESRRPGCRYRRWCLRFS